MVALQASTKIWGWRDATGAVAARKARSCKDWSLEARPAGRGVEVEGEGGRPGQGRAAQGAAGGADKSTQKESDGVNPKKSAAKGHRGTGPVADGAHLPVTQSPNNLCK